MCIVKSNHVTFSFTTACTSNSVISNNSLFITTKNSLKLHSEPIGQVSVLTQKKRKILLFVVTVVVVVMVIVVAVVAAVAV